MTSVITGDIINSTKYKDPTIWLKPLKESLETLTNKKTDWEIFRGDSFQIEISNIYESFIAAVYIKACIKMIKNLDVRMAIGIGSKGFKGNNITESNGKVFQYSGSVLEVLKKEKTNLKIKTDNSKFDDEMNLYFKLALIGMDSWTINSAEITKLFYEYPNKTQDELSKLINISQDAVSKRIKRGHLEKIFELDLMFRLKLENINK